MDNDQRITLLNDIQSGVYDSHLKDIAMAVFLRRDTLQGTHSFTTAAKEYAENMYQTLTVQTPVIPGMATPSGNVHLLPKSVSSAGQYRTSQTFNYRGQSFYRSDLEGKTFEVPANYPIVELQGHIMLIVKVATKRVMLQWAQPTIIKTRRYSIRNYARNQTPFSVGMTVLDHILRY